MAVERTFEFQNQSRYGSLSSSTCALPASGRIALVIRRRRSASRAARVSPVARTQRVVQVREREHRHAIAIAVEPRDVRVLVAAAFDQHLHRERLPGGVGRPPALVRRRLLRQLASRDRRRPASRMPGVDVVLQIRRDLEHVQQVRGEVRRHRRALRPASRRSRRSRTGSARAPSASAGPPAASSPGRCPAA